MQSRKEDFENMDITELDKRLIMQDAWVAGTQYKTLLIANKNTFNTLSSAIDTSVEDTYKGHKIQIDNDMQDDTYVIGVYKKGDSNE
jgi:hypothetical protein